MEENSMAFFSCPFYGIRVEKGCIKMRRVIKYTIYV